MTTLTVRSYAGESDLEPIAALINLCEAVDQLDESTSVDDLRLEFGEPGFDPERDLRLWEDERGLLIGFAQLWVSEPGAQPDGFLWYRVHPEARDGELDPQIIAWAEERLREVGHERGTAMKLLSATREHNRERMAVLEAHGFTVSRYFLRMARSLHDPLPDVEMPEGFTLRHVSGLDEVAAWVEMFNQSFIDHYNHHPLSEERARYHMSEPKYRPDHDLVAVAADGTFAAFCHCRIDPDENARTGRQAGWINLLGTRRGFRRRGLGRAMLLAGLHLIKNEGMDTALLGVDAASLTNATRLYESVGFRTLYTTVSYSKEL